MVIGIKDSHRSGSALLTSFRAQECPLSTPKSIVVDSKSIVETHVGDMLELPSLEYTITSKDANATTRDLKKLDAHALHFLNNNIEVAIGDMKALEGPQVCVIVVASFEETTTAPVVVFVTYLLHFPIVIVQCQSFMDVRDGIVSSAC